MITGFEHLLCGLLSPLTTLCSCGVSSQRESCSSSAFSDLYSFPLISWAHVALMHGLCSYQCILTCLTGPVLSVFGSIRPSLNSKQMLSVSRHHVFKCDFKIFISLWRLLCSRDHFFSLKHSISLELRWCISDHFEVWVKRVKNIQLLGIIMLISLELYWECFLSIRWH